MIREIGCTEEALTGLGIVILVLVLVAGSVLALVAFSGGTPNPLRTFPGGLVAESMYISGDNLQIVGSMYGFPMTRRTTGPLTIVPSQDDAGKLGMVRFTVSLFIGDTGAIDMDKIRVSWGQEHSSEILHKSPPDVLICPNWTISNKYNMLPGRTADADEWLEPNEQFELTLCPTTGIQPYG
ncbi:hypothetical protein, partial [Methanoregula sp.]|uniref:hypothetical protein n=1 Tax=Methanoregula sp. TaxID=2052170 RepID=UPI000CBE3BDD